MIDAKHAAKAEHRDNAAMLEATDRPWVGIDAIDIALSVGSIGPISIVERNFGHSPALGVKPQIWQFTFGDGCPADQSMPLAQPIDTAITLFPGQTTRTTINIAAKPLTQQDIDLINDGTCRIRLAGRIDYTDIRKNARWTTLRYLYIPANNAFGAEATGNDAK